MGDLDAVTLAEEEDTVIADHVAAADGLDADLVGGAWADVAMPLVARGFGKIATAGLGHCFSQAQGRA